MRMSWVAAACCSGALLGCSTHPLIEDFARVNTYDIVQKIRCEARDQIKLLKFNVDESRELHKHIIGFDFKLDISEKNNASGGKLDFTNPFVGGKFSLALSGGAERTRRSERFFRVFATFHELSQIQEKDCDFDLGNQNIVYPIAGNVGMAEVIRTYWNLQNTVGVHLEGLKKSAAPEGNDGDSGKKKPTDEPNKTGDKRPKSDQPYSLIEPDEAAAEIEDFQKKLSPAPETLSQYPSVFSDTLTFTTKLNAGIKPSLEIGAGAGSIKLTNATIEGSVERQDIHQVAVAIARRDIPAGTALPKLALYAQTGRNPSLITRSDTAAIILELDRLRNRDEDVNIIEQLTTQP